MHRSTQLCAVIPGLDLVMAHTGQWPILVLTSVVWTVSLPAEPHALGQTLHSTPSFAALMAAHRANHDQPFSPAVN